MTTAMLDNAQQARSYAGFLTPAPLPDGRTPEERIVHTGISWDNYLAFDQI